MNRETDLSALNAHFDTERRLWIPGEGDGELAGQKIEWNVREVEVEDGGPVTDKRIITEISPAGVSENLRTCLFLAGFAHTDAQIYGDSIACLAEVFQERGMLQNTRFVGIGTMGKGSEEYIENKDKISAIRMMDEIRDAPKLALLLKEMGLIENELDIVAHSMGHLNAMAILDVLTRQDTEIEKILGVTGVKVSNIFDFMPATDSLGMARIKIFFSIADELHRIVPQYAIKKGQISLGKKSYDRKMFGGASFDDEEHWKRSVPDSASRALEWFFNMSDLFKDLMKRENVGTRVHVFQGKNDRLIPPGVSERFYKRLSQSNNGPSAGVFVKGPSHFHSLPHSKMTDRQRAEIQGFIRAALDFKADSV